MENNKLSSNIELSSGEFISLILDGSVPCLVLHPNSELVSYINDLVRPVKYFLSSKGYYVKTYNNNDVNPEFIETSLPDSNFSIIVLDGLNPNLVFAYGFLGGKEKNILTFFNDDGAELEFLNKSKNVVRIDVSKIGPDELVLEIKDIVENYLKEYSELIIDDLVAESLLRSDINDYEVIKEVSSISSEVINYYLDLDRPDLDRINNIYNKILYNYKSKYYVCQ